MVNIQSDTSRLQLGTLICSCVDSMADSAVRFMRKCLSVFLVKFRLKRNDGKRLLVPCCHSLALNITVVLEAMSLLEH
jgi:hypothetical protein